MAILFVIMLITLGLALRAATVRRHPSVAGSTSRDESAVIDSYARTSLLVLLCLVGLFALGLMYGNVLGAGAGS
ncbi:MAG TPA: hypothetical protein VLR46_03590 [Candidatus Dormibacteraeota bacterium]|nr:hypothetical protein [Candidatus Dormibacteraeota bacterium]